MNFCLLKAITVPVLMTLGLMLMPQGLLRAQTDPNPEPTVPTIGRIPELKSGSEGARPASFKLSASASMRIHVELMTDAANEPLSDIGLPLNASTWQTIETEDFEGVFPGEDWSVWDDNQDGYDRFWDADDFKPHTGTRSAWPARGGVNGLDPQTSNYPNNMDTWMVYGPFDLSDATEAQAVFQLWREIEIDWDFIFFGASGDGSAFDGYTWDGVEDWIEVTALLSDWVGDDTVWVGWYFHSDGSVAYDGPFVDDISITKQVTPPPGISIDLSGSNVVLNWNAVAGADHYEVWSANNTPYFSPGSDCAAGPSCTIVLGTTHTHSSAIGNPDINHYYVVITVDGVSRSEPSNRVAEFDYRLNPGG